MKAPSSNKIQEELTTKFVPSTYYYQTYSITKLILLPHVYIYIKKPVLVYFNETYLHLIEYGADVIRLAKKGTSLVAEYGPSILKDKQSNV